MLMRALTHSRFPLRTELFPFATFPIQDGLLPGESGPGYVLRMASKNHVGYYELLRHIDLYPYPYLTIDATTKIAPLFGVMSKNIMRVTAENYKIYGQCHTKLNGLIFKKPYLIRQRSPQVCHLCLKENSYAQLAWDLTLYTACIAHKISLIDHCPSCNKPLSWARNDLSLCKCGKPLFSDSVKSIPASESQLLVSKVISHKFAGDIPCSISNTFLFQLFDSLSLDIFMRLVWSFGLHDQSKFSRRTQGKQIPCTNSTIELINHSISRINYALNHNFSSPLEIDINQTSLNDVLNDANYVEFKKIHHLLDKVSELDKLPRILDSNSSKQLSLFE